MIIGAGQIFKSHQQNFLIFAEVSAGDNRGSADFQVTSLNLGYFCKFQLVIIGAVKIIK